MELVQVVNDVVEGLIVLDGCGVPFKQFRQGVGNAEYLMYLYSLFQPYCGTPGGPKVITY